MMTINQIMSLINNIANQLNGGIKRTRIVNSNVIGAEKHNLKLE